MEEKGESGGGGGLLLLSVKQREHKTAERSRLLALSAGASVRHAAAEMSVEVHQASNTS